MHFHTRSKGMEQTINFPLYRFDCSIPLQAQKYILYVQSKAEL